MCSTKPKFIIYCVFFKNRYNGIKTLKSGQVNCVLVVTFASKAQNALSYNIYNSNNS